jgi:hypothetical protein
MKANEVIIKEQNLTKEESKELIINMLNKYIDFLKISSLSTWERNHRSSFNATEKKVEALKIKQKQINLLIDTLAKDEDTKLDFSLSFEVNCSGKSNTICESTSSKKEYIDRPISI